MVGNSWAEKGKSVSLSFNFRWKSVKIKNYQLDQCKHTKWHCHFKGLKKA